MKNQLILSALLAVGLPAGAQSNAKTDESYHITIVKNDNGKETVIDRTFATSGEMQAFMTANNIDAPEPPAAPEPPTEPDVIAPPAPPTPPAAPRVLLPVSARLYSNCGKPVERKSEKVVVIKRDGTTEVHKTTETEIKDAESDNNTANVTALKVYPNPAKGEFTVQFNAEKPADVKMRITNLEGKEVYSETLKNFSGRFEKKIARDNMPKGTYILDIETAGQKESTRIAVQ